VQQNAFVNKISARLYEHTASDKQSQEAASRLISDYLFNNVVPCANSFGNMHERHVKYPFVKHRFCRISRVDLQVCIKVEKTKHFVKIGNNLYA